MDRERGRARQDEERPEDGQVVLLLHGEPSWCYLYRHMIPPLVEAGLRVVAPDLIGFGRSDKPVSKSDYSYAAHVDWMREFLDSRPQRDVKEGPRQDLRPEVCLSGIPPHHFQEGDYDGVATTIASTDGY